MTHVHHSSKHSLIFFIFLSFLVGGVIGYVVNNQYCNKKLYTHGNKDLALAALLFEQVLWSRQYITSVACQADDLQLIAQRLIENTDQLGLLFKPLYGQETSNTIATLFKEYIFIFIDLVAATKLNKNDVASQLKEKWEKQIESITATLTALNPQQPSQALYTNLHDYMAAFVQQIEAKMNKQYPEDMQAVKAAIQSAAALAAELTEISTKQFSQT